MTEEQKKELMELLKTIVKAELDTSNISFDKFMAAVDEKLNQIDRKYMPAFDPSSIKDLNSNSKVEKLFRAMKAGDIVQVKALSEGVDADGGYLVPTEYRNELIRSIEAGNSVRNLVRVIPIGSGSGTYPRQATKAGLVNVDELGTYQEDKPTFDQVNYKAHKFGKIVPCSSELYEDSSINVSAVVMEDFRESAVITENTQVFAGAGDTKNAMGIFTTGDYAHTDLAAALKGDDLTDLFFNLGSGYRLNARWLLNTFALKVVTKLKDTTGRGLFLPDPREPGNFLIYAKPVEVFDEIAVDDVAKTTKIGFGDWKRAYYLFDRQQLAVLTTNVGGTSFTKGTVDTRVDERFDGQVADKKAAVVLTGVLVA